MSITLPILLKTDDFVAIDKPPGLSIHNLEDPQNVLTVLEKQLGVSTLFPVHRLDKETSGIQIVALNTSASQKISQAFQDRAVEKIYHGILRGVLSQTQGVWRQPLTDKAEGRKSPAGAPGARVPCETHYRVLKSNKYFTQCEFDLKTGRQHQIRKHSALDQHALVGDGRYGDNKYNRRIAEIYHTPRMFLHCSQLQFLEFKIQSPLPDDFSRLMESALTL